MRESGDSVCFDFGRHLAGRIKLNLSTRGSHHDAPTCQGIKFAE